MARRERYKREDKTTFLYFYVRGVYCIQKNVCKIRGMRW
nr:MAG TPA: hypothetical protein [Caudoviricetes sp.]